MIRPVSLDPEQSLLQFVCERAGQARTSREIAGIVFEALHSEAESFNDSTLERAKRLLVVAWRSAGLCDHDPTAA